MSKCEKCGEHHGDGRSFMFQHMAELAATQIEKAKLWDAFEKHKKFKVDIKFFDDEATMEIYDSERGVDNVLDALSEAIYSDGWVKDRIKSVTITREK